MELFTTLDNVIIHDETNRRSLWCNRIDAQFIPSHGDKLLEAWNPVCKGLIYGVIGKMQLLPGSDWKLLVISDRRFVGYLPEGVEVYNIKRVSVLPLSADVIEYSDLDLNACSLHHGEKEGCSGENKSTTQQKVQQTWNNIKSGANNITGKTNVFLKDVKEREKTEKRLLEELLKMFNDSGSFYFSPNGDLSNSRQRMELFSSRYSWSQTDDSFFWNKFMLKDLIESDCPMAKDWVLPIIQGFIQIERCSIDHLEYLNAKNGLDQADGIIDEEEELEESWDFVDFGTEKYRTAENLKEDEFDLIVISRRSRHQAGTRYKRRGVNDTGHVANYVETEQIVCVLDHIVSHVQVRGSVPVYWSQPGYKYRPLPQIDKGKEETKLAFAKHFDEELQRYNSQIIISLVELTGREKVIADAYLGHIFEYNSDKLIYVTFDFHEYCRGMKFENVSVLVEAMQQYVHNMGFHWVDDSGSVMSQKGVFRVNCMDCLDRTNVVQAATAREVIEIILRKLGRLLPEEGLPFSCRRVHNGIWANNGDAISRQYAGTAAMKGDYTRTGERKVLGVMKDGYNSANRYYLNRFKDNYRQTVIDMMLGKSVAEDLSAIATSSNTTIEDDVWTSEKEECIAQLVRHSELTLLPSNEECLGGWALVDPFSFVSPSDSPQDEDVILMLTHHAYYVARYNDEMEELFSYQRIPLENLEKIEIGLETVHYRGQHIFMRLLYRHNRTPGYFHTMRTIQRRSLDESKGILLSIAEVFLYVCRNQSIDIRVVETKFDKKRSKPQPNIKPLSSKRTLSTSSRSKSFHASDKDVPQSKDLSTTIQSNGEIPSIAVQDTTETSDFVEYHQMFSPVNKNESKKKAQGEETKSESPGENTLEETGANANDQGVKPQNKMDAFFQKTKLAIGNVGPKLRDLSTIPRKPGSSSTKRTDSESGDVVPAKSTFQKLNDKFINRSRGDVKNPLKMLPEFRNKIQTVLRSPRTRRRQPMLSDRDIELRSYCKTKILEL